MRNFLKLPVVIVSVASLAASLSVCDLGPASAQSPYPNKYMYEKFYSNPVNNSTTDHPTDIAVVDGLSIGPTCTMGAPTSDAISSKVVAYLATGKVTIAEFAPSSACHTEPEYETAADHILSYVTSHASNYQSRFGGIMIEEESERGFSSSDFAKLNNHVYGQIANTPGISVFFVSPFSGGGSWSPAQWSQVVGLAAEVPEISNSYTVSLANGDNVNKTVLWNPNYMQPYNSQSTDIGAITHPAAPYSNQFGSSSTTTFYWQYYFN